MPAYAINKLGAGAYGNMTELHTLSLQLGTYATSSVMSQMSCRLKKFVCIIASDPSYPVSQFLSTQPCIEELYVVCRPEDISTLDPEALPALRDLAAPLQLLPVLIRTRLSRLSRLSVLGTIGKSGSFIELIMALRSAKPPESLELVVGVDVNAISMVPKILTPGLAVLGLYAPFIALLRLEIHEGCIKRVSWSP
ncbi:hypothetical protein RhiTH_006999 [Rhizoctonia solani]